MVWVQSCSRRREDSYITVCAGGGDSLHNDFRGPADAWLVFPERMFPSNHIQVVTGLPRPALWVPPACCLVIGMFFLFQVATESSNACLCPENGSASPTLLGALLWWWWGEQQSHHQECRLHTYW